MVSRSDEGEFDAIFAEVAGRLGSVELLLENFFGFLHRRTDFYVEFDPVETPRATMGFPSGVAQRILTNAFLSYDFKRYEVEEKRRVSGPTPAQLASSVGDGSRGPIDPVLSVTSTSPGIEELPVQLSTVTSSSPGSVSLPTPRLTEEGKQIPVSNGGVAPNYYWTQTLDEVTVYIDVPDGTRGKDIKCTILPRHLLIDVRGIGMLIDGDLEEPVRLDESMWTLGIARGMPPQIIVTLLKVRKNWWKHVIVGHPEIDTSKVDSSQRIDEYDESTQAAIRKIMFDQRQKMLGLPTSDEILGVAVPQPDSLPLPP